MYKHSIDSVGNCVMAWWRSVPGYDRNFRICWPPAKGLIIIDQGRLIIRGTSPAGEKNIARSSSSSLVGHFVLRPQTKFNYGVVPYDVIGVGLRTSYDELVPSPSPLFIKATMRTYSSTSNTLVEFPSSLLRVNK